MSDQSGAVPREDPADSMAIEQALAMIDADPSSAAARLRDLADHGSPRAMALLGCAYQQGVGVAVDLYEVESLYQRAEAAGAMEGVFGRCQICLLRQACAGSRYARRDVQVSLAPSISAQLMISSLRYEMPRPSCGRAVRFSGAYMVAPYLPSLHVMTVSKVKIAVIHPDFV